MRERTPERFVAGMRAMIRIGSPVRQWMYTLEPESKAWLTPTQYMVTLHNASESNSGPQYVEVEIARVMPPYAIVYHHDCQGWVRLWLDTREVRLFAVSE
jgi:hypothetical protein